MLFKDRKELADKYKEWVKQSIDNNHTMILDCAESVITFLDINGYLNEVAHGEWIDVNGDGSLLECGNCHEGSCCKGNYCSNCGARMDGVENE